MDEKNPLITTSEDQFIVGDSDFSYFEHHAYRLEGCAILFCRDGEAEMMVDQCQGRLVRNTLMLLLPGVYLRRVSAISQTAHVVLCLLLLASGFMLLTVLPRLRVTNLQTFALQPGEVGDFLIQLARDFEQAAGRPDFAELVQAQDADKGQPDQPNKQAKDPKLVCGRSFWLEVTVEDRGKKSIYAPALALLHRLELDEHGVPVKTGAFTAAAELLDWAADWWENTQAPEPAKS